MPTWEDVVAAGTRFPGVEESTSYGTPSLKVRGKFMCRLRTNPDALVVRVIDVADQEALLKATRTSSSSRRTTRAGRACSCGSRPSTLVQLAELVEDAWRVQAPKRLVKAHDASEGFGESAET